MKKLILISTAACLIITPLFFNGCLKDTKYPDIIAANDTIHGTLKYKQTDAEGGNIVAWPYGSAVFKAVAGSSDEIASAAVNADGTFTLVLPGTLWGGYLGNLTDVSNYQGGTLKATPSSVRFLSTIMYRVDYKDNGSAKTILTNLYTLKANNSVDKSYFYNFYDSDGTFAGTTSAGNVFNWSFKKGWGMVESYITNASLSLFSTKSVSTVPSNAVWVNLQ